MNKQTEKTKEPVAKQEAAYEKKDAQTAAKTTFVPKRVRNVIVPQFKQKANETVYWKFLTPITGKKKMETIKDETTGQNKQVEKTIFVAQVADCSTGEVGQIVVGDVLMKNLQETYLDNGYVGKAFEIEKKDVEGKRYKSYLIYEIEG